MIVEHKTRFAHIVHDSKSEDAIIQIFTRVLPLLTEKPIIVKSDCAPEYHTPMMKAFLKDVHGVKEMRHSNEHNQAANGMVEKFGDTFGRGLRVALLQSGLPLAFWGAAAIMVTDLYNSTLHSSLGGDSPYFRCTGRMPDISFFRPFGCSMVYISRQGPSGTQKTGAAGRKRRLCRHRNTFWSQSIYKLLSSN